VLTGVSRVPTRWALEYCLEVGTCGLVEAIAHLTLLLKRDVTSRTLEVQEIDAGDDGE